MSHFLLTTGFLARLQSVPVAEWLIWSALITLSATLVIVMRTRWGQSRPLQKCAVLSLLVHLVFACLAMTVRIVAGDGGGAAMGPPVRVRIIDDSAGQFAMAPIMPDVIEEVIPPALLEPPALAKAEAPAESPAEAPAETKIGETELIEDEPELELNEAPDVTSTVAVAPAPTPTSEVEIGEEAVEKSTPSVPTTEITKSSNAFTAPAPAARNPAPSATADESPAIRPTPPAAAATYALRTAPGRLGLIESQGGNAQTEAAVNAALKWLAAAQSADGRWDAARFGAGREMAVLGHNRHGAGRDADTGITALAILAFLGGGHSHVQGDH